MSRTETYTVIGYWDTEERYVDFVEATSARDAETRLLADIPEDATLRIAGTLVGEHQGADTYTVFIDPDDEANLTRQVLSVVADEPEVVEWTVLGLIVRDGEPESEQAAWNEKTGGERYLGHEMALNARDAEAVARGRVRERGPVRLLVCAVLAGQHFRAEAYPFSDHDLKPE